MATMSEEEDWRFSFKIHCTAKGKHGPRELARLSVGNEPDTRAMIEEFVPVDKVEDFYACDMLMQHKPIGGRRIPRPGRENPKRDFKDVPRVDGEEGDGTGHLANPGPTSLDEVFAAVADDRWAPNTYRFRCPTCGRDFPIGAKRLRDSLITLGRMDHWTVDISLLP